MSYRRRDLPILAVSLLLLAALSCQAGGLFGAAENTPTPAQPASQPALATQGGAPAAPTAPPTALPTAQPPAAAVPATPAPAPAPASICAQETCTFAGTFLLARPVAPPGRNTIDRSNRFGELERRQREANRGVSFLNSSGTPVLAAAAGKVVVAGDDSQQSYGEPAGSYGNLVILEHSLNGISQPVYTLYAHLSKVSVQEGDQVAAGQEIGLVGMSGGVRGSTLYFEVRLGENSNAAVRNPELWLAPLADETGQPMGAIAGWVHNSDGDAISLSNILVERLAGPGQPPIERIYLKTYANRSLSGIDPWQESFAASDLPAGRYQVSFWRSGMQQREVEVKPGQLTVINFQMP